jgi:hypothetical protein
MTCEQCTNPATRESAPGTGGSTSDGRHVYCDDHAFGAGVESSPLLLTPPELKRHQYTTIGGKIIRFLECSMRFESGIEGSGVWPADAACKRIGARDRSEIISDAVLIQEVSAPSETSASRSGRYVMVDVLLHVDTDGEEWTYADGFGSTCPRCLVTHRDNIRLLITTGINPFTDEPFTRESMDDCDTSADFAFVREAEGLGREPSVNADVIESLAS